MLCSKLWEPCGKACGKNYRKLAMSFLNLVTHRFQKYGPFEDIAKQEDFKGLPGMTKLYCQWLVGYWWLGLWNFFWKLGGAFSFLILWLKRVVSYLFGIYWVFSEVLEYEWIYVHRK